MSVTVVFLMIILKFATHYENFGQFLRNKLHFGWINFCQRRLLENFWMKSSCIQSLGLAVKIQYLSWEICSSALHRVDEEICFLSASML